MAFGVLSNADTKVSMICGDTMSAALAAVLVTPLAMMVDVAVSQSAGGQISVPRALMNEAAAWCTNPFQKVREPAFWLVWFVYLCTYCGANVTEAVCVLYLGVSPTMPKLISATVANMGSCMYKDAALARLFGKAEAERPFPPAGYVCFLVRDILANVGGFTLPPIVAPLLLPWLGASSDTATQLFVPAAMNLVSTPLHFFALDLYNHPDASFAQHCAAVGRVYLSASASRICKGFAAFGLGGVSNKRLRVLVGSLR